MAWERSGGVRKRVRVNERERVKMRVNEREGVKVRVREVGVAWVWWEGPGWSRSPWHVLPETLSVTLTSELCGRLPLPVNSLTHSLIHLFKHLLISTHLHTRSHGGSHTHTRPHSLIYSHSFLYSLIHFLRLSHSYKRPHSPPVSELFKST